MPFPEDSFPEESKIHRMSDAFYVVDRRHCYFRGKLMLPLLPEMSEELKILTWVTVQASEYKKMLSQETDSRSCFGVLTSDLPFLKKGKGVSVKCLFSAADPNFKNPYILVSDSKSHVFSFQNSGLPQEIYLSWMKELDSSQ